MTLMDAVCVEAVETALCVGYRHIDTAERYRNESEVGEGLRRGLRAAHVALDFSCSIDDADRCQLQRYVQSNVVFHCVFP